MPSFRSHFRRRSSASHTPSAPPSPPSTSGNGRVVSLLRRSASGSSSYSRGSSHHLSRQRQHNRNFLLSPRFDACIEACDALAASSRKRHTSVPSDGGSGAGDSQHFSTESYDGVEDDSSNDAAEGSYEDGKDGGLSGDNSREYGRLSHTDHDSTIPDCSVLVSPDGALLFTSSSSQTSPPNHGIGGNTSSNSNINGRQDDNWHPWTRMSSVEDCDGMILEEEYESAVVCGNDLSPNGDADSNGFSARGWNHDAATVALGISRDYLGEMELFVEELATRQKEKGACVVGAVERLSGFRTRLLDQNGRSMERERLGPLLSRGTNLSVAIVAMEDYYASTAEGDLEWWRMACSERRGPTRPMSIELKELNNRRERRTGNKQEQQSSSSDYTKLVQGLLPKLQSASEKANQRTLEREHALCEIRSKFSEAENILKKQKEWAESRWKLVSDEESNIDRLYAQKKMEQHMHYEEQRKRVMLQETALLDSVMMEGEAMEEEGPLSREVWEMVQGVATSIEDFGHTGYSPKTLLHKPNADAMMSQRFQTSGYVISPGMVDEELPQLTPLKTIKRADLEGESEIHDLRTVALAADESVEDAAGKLLNIMSRGDTTLRSARLAAESCLLSECIAAHRCLGSLVALERASLTERLRRLEVLEAAVDAIDVRKDIDKYIRADKLFPGGRSRAGEDDDGGIAAALAVLNSHGCEKSLDSYGGADLPQKYRNIERPSYFKGWGEGSGSGSCESDDDEDVNPEIIGDVLKMLFGDESLATVEHPSTTSAITSTQKEPLRDQMVNLVSSALAEKSRRGQSHRKSILYELNSQRSRNTSLGARAEFDMLCRLFDSFLSGCGCEPVDVSDTKMLMILSQTFYFVDNRKGGDCESGRLDVRTEECSGPTTTTKDRESRVYVKSRICHHKIWSDEDFWDQAAYQCVSESLAKSGVLMNYVQSSIGEGDDGMNSGGGSRGCFQRAIKWHDLAPDEYSGAATQVHSVVFAQLGTLSHSMIELGCGISQACSFVRRLSIRYQLPLSLRITLIQHLTKKVA